MKKHALLTVVMVVALFGLAGGQTPTGKVPTPMPLPSPTADPLQLPKPANPSVGDPLRVPSVPPQPPGVPPPPVAPTPPTVPPKSEADKLRDKLEGAWTVIFSDNDAVKHGRLSFTQQRVTVRDGDSSFEAPYTVQPGSDAHVLTIRVLNQPITGNFTLLDGRVLTMRINHPSAGGKGPTLVVLTRVAPPATLKREERLLPTDSRKQLAAIKRPERH